MKLSQLVVIAVFLFLTPVQLKAQASMVPVYHEVYDWLHYQRVLGSIPQYNYESLPLTRGQITALLNQIEEDNLSYSDARTRTSYLREFSKDSLIQYKNYAMFKGEGSFISRSLEGIFSDEEPHIYVWDKENTNAVFDVALNPTSTLVTDDSKDRSTPLYHYYLLRTYGTYEGTVGFHIEQFALSNVSDKRTFAYRPFFGRTAKYLRDGENMGHFEAYAGIHKNSWALFIGRGTLKQGVGKKDNLVFSREGIPFDWIRFTINSTYFDYTSVTGFLSWDPEIIQIPGFNNLSSRTSPSRYTVMHQFQVKPAPWISVGYYEMVNYSNREFELTYLNPVTRLALMEFEQDDQDNGFVGINGSLRPIKGLEIYAETLVDDIRTPVDLFRLVGRDGDEDDFKTTLARHLGISYALKTGQVFNINYQRIDPSVYAHRFDLNAHSEAGFGLGSQVGPNGDELSFNIDQWFSSRSRISVGYSFNRHGLNYFDSNGNFVDAGGDINESYYNDPTTGRLVKATNFLEGDVHTWNSINAEFVYEPWRGFIFSGELSHRNITKGNQLKDLFILEFGLTIGK